MKDMIDKKHKKEAGKMMKGMGMGKPMSYMPKGGSQSPKGDIGLLRQLESKKVGNKFKCDRVVKSPF